MKTFWLLFLLFPLQIFAQISVSGTVTNAKNSEPIPYATIYVNGTSNGTITNTSGQFTLDKVYPPCEIVFSHISYETFVIALNKASETNIDVILKPKDVVLGDVEVTDNNRREENLRHFKERFLGTDNWGKNAYFENDSVLVFRREKVKDQADHEHESGLLETDSSSYRFFVNTKGPLLIQMPLLGYKLHVNLIHYSELRTNTEKKYEFHTLGYFYFQPTKEASKRKTNRFRKKRLQAYYNSDRHFCSSLYTNQLKENGYDVITRVPNPETQWYDFNEFDLDKHLIRSSNEAKIIGLKNKSFLVKYFEKFGRPVNLNTRDGIERPFSMETMAVSKVYFLKDTCTIRSDGSRPENSIMFGPKIGNKRAGAMLPNDFRPKNIKLK